MNGLISVIIPCFKQAHFLNECVASLQNQTCHNWEAIIVNDGSPDETERVALNLARVDPRVRYVFKSNGGLSSARNSGIAASNGNYIQFLDADDKLDSKKFEIQRRILEEKQDLDIVYGNAWYFVDDTSETMTRGPYANFSGHDWIADHWHDPRPMLTKILEGNIFPVCSPLIRKSLVDTVGDFDIDLPSVEDWDYWLRAAIAGKAFYYCGEEGTDSLIRRHPSSMTAETDSPAMRKAIFMVRLRGHSKFAEGPERRYNFARLLRANVRIGDDGRLDRYKSIEAITTSRRELRIARLSKFTDKGGVLFPVTNLIGRRLRWKTRCKIADIGLSFTDI